MIVESRRYFLNALTIYLNVKQFTHCLILSAIILSDRLYLKALRFKTKYIGFVCRKFIYPMNSTNFHQWSSNTVILFRKVLHNENKTECNLVKTKTYRGITLIYSYLDGEPLCWQVSHDDMTSTSMARPRHVVWQESRRDAGNPRTCPNKTKDMWKCRLHRGKGLALNQLEEIQKSYCMCAVSVNNDRHRTIVARN